MKNRLGIRFNPQGWNSSPFGLWEWKSYYFYYNYVCRNRPYYVCTII